MDNTKRNSKVPVLRFPGFEKEWEEKSFGELYEKHNVKNDLSFGVDKIISVANMYYKEDANVGNEEYLRSYNVFRLGDIAYEGNKSANFAYGRFVENTIGDGIVSHVFDVYSPISPDHCLDYWKYAINYERIMRPILEKSTIKSTMMTNLIAKDFLKQSILVPSLTEQKRIADCLSAIDELISVQDQKVECLKSQKQGLLQQLFPQNNETVPRLRFPGFSREWEKLEIGQLCSVNRGVRVTRKDLDGDGQYPVFQNTNSPMGYYHSYNVNANNPFVIIGGSAGSMGFCKTAFWAADDCVFFGDNESIDKYFLFLTLLVHELEVKSNVRGGNIPRIDRKALERISISIPSVKEQKKIASCLSVFDEAILAETDKLNALKVHKKGLMQQLFPNQ